MVTYWAFDEVIDFITSLPKPEQVLAYQPSASSVERLEVLLEKKRNGQLSDEETHELDQYLMIEHMMRIARKKAKKQLGE
ncbi:MAG: hypothetical protein KKG00_09860 [Bacteroidetes bacterium]|nr:hypothetical protein [Bacteroidota bacterium]